MVLPGLYQQPVKPKTTLATQRNIQLYGKRGLTSGKGKEKHNIERKVNAALRYLTENNNHGILPSAPELIK